MTEERLRVLLGQTERHISAVTESIERQQRIISELESKVCGDPAMIDAARALLGTMKKALKLYTTERDRIRRLLQPN